jgi:hypothetical protein
MHPNDYRKLRESVGEREDVAAALDINPKHLAKREQGHQRITREAEYAMQWVAYRKPKSAFPKRAPIKKRNDSRKAKEWARAYESPERVEWIKALPCVVCGKRPSENAHTVTGGMSRKANADTIVPLCKAHHRELHKAGRRTFEAKHGTGDLLELARGIDMQWKAQ